MSIIGSLHPGLACPLSCKKPVISPLESTLYCQGHTVKATCSDVSREAHLCPSDRLFLLDIDWWRLPLVLYGAKRMT
jgi:hypothetical protein